MGIFRKSKDSISPEKQKPEQRRLNLKAQLFIMRHADIAKLDDTEINREVMQPTIDAADKLGAFIAQRSLELPEPLSELHVFVTSTKRAKITAEFAVEELRWLRDVSGLVIPNPKVSYGRTPGPEVGEIMSLMEDQELELRKVEAVDTNAVLIVGHANTMDSLYLGLGYYDMDFNQVIGLFPDNKGSQIAPEFYEHF